MYYEINEKMARMAKEMISFYSYEEGSATAEYRKCVDAAAEVAARQKEKTSPFYHAKIDALLDSYSRRLAAWINDENRNTASCPSVMISGPANFPVRKKERQNARERSLMEEYDKIQSIITKIRGVGTGPIDFADPNAREMLAERVEKLQKELDREKAVNAYYRKNKTIIGCPELSEESAKRLQKGFEDLQKQYSCYNKPFADYTLTSVRTKLNKAKERLAEYDSRQQQDPEEAETEVEGCRIIKNVEQDRLQLVFNGKPDEETRAALKSNDFRWSPRNGAWQRQLTNNAIYAAKKVLGI